MKKVNAAPAATGIVTLVYRNTGNPKNTYKMKPAYQFPQFPDHTTRETHSAENKKILNHMKKLCFLFKKLAITVLFILIVMFAQAITKTWTGGAISTAWATSENWDLSDAPGSGEDILTRNGNLLIDGPMAVIKQVDCGITCPALVTVGRSITTTDAFDAGYRQFAFYQNSFNPAILTR